MVYLSLSVFISGLSLFALHLFGRHYSLSPLSLLSYHLSSSVVSMSFLIFCHSLSPPMSFLPAIPSSLPSSPLSNQVVSAQPPPPSSAAREGAQEKWISSLSLSVVEAVRETILSPHPSPLTGQRSDRHDPPSAALYHVSLPAIFPGGKRKPAGEMGRGWERGCRRRKRGMI